MFKLKGYQQRAVDVMQSFLSHCLSSDSVEDAYKLALEEQELPSHAYRDYGFEQVPYFCMRIPTGGGKTVLGSYAIEVAARHYLETEAPIALWLVPSITIREQTVEALKTPGHPYREKLDAAFNRQVLVLDIDEVTQIRPQDLGNKTIVVVSTLANLRVSDTSGRKVYAYHENFEPHFAKVPANHPFLPLLERVSEADVQENGLSSREIGNIKFSFANLLALYRPVVIVDEAHNARTSLTFDTLRRVHPAAVIEFTATPNTTSANGSNVLFHVSAAELKAEEMIKLPIVLTEHQNWQDAVQDAVITRNKLQTDAQKDEDYIRPIALFQAENKKGEVTVEVLKDHLINQLGIDEDKIAVATGSQRELDGINLFDQNCLIEYIITIEALKEGWDCSFAYVFCSVKQVSSSKDAEQLLGRVLRMPYASRRTIEDLNRAYAHLATSKFAKAAQELTDKLIAMGFEEMEIAAFLREQAPTGGQGELFGGEPEQSKAKPTPPPAIVVEVEDLPDLTELSELEKKQITMTRDEQTDTAVVKVTGEVSPSIQKALTKHVKAGKKRKAFERDIRVHNQAIEATKAPSERGEKFGSLPYLCMMEQGELELVESEVFLHAHSWNLLDYPAELTNFVMNETSNSFAIDMDGKSLTYKVADQKEVIAFNQGFIDVTEQDLVRWLDRELRQPDVLQHQLVGFLGRLVKNLLQKPNLTLTALVRNKFPLARAIRDLIRLYRKQAQRAGYQACLFGAESTACVSDEFMYHFEPSHYPSRPPYYSGRYKFQKHYFPQNLIEDLKATGEEYECAKAIDGLPEIKHWIRNLVRRDQASFWLPLAHNKFYPDFVCELNDGRMLVVEYKGEAYVTNDDSAEKRAIGDKWAELSNGKCLFIMAVEQDGQGRDVRQQIQALISK
ncbi:DEAD/DEAH box helicase family protein [Vibrio parahaemolyticus]|uniref:DEAD/DEAH box helicase n=1 Tax=Vibrio parahaemolyticus TaxID=670 RepID=UPI000A3760A4|nr:DEAD/DEAH box helicase family protein [Vibrio parahaemolyticus]MCA6690684.1 DEAD/DEAH box helicase family protein [Vibrio parahaemolyticus]MDF5585067.1 DEAD/DEAH box helicase family protein [Vibrio parahaemolyticus]MDF5590181.1 DEAD/DEAH box helicase family protein [Vibrio parahaemolyticus]MDG2872447.1 DEAD/DEAH box helicase family protein [Vibrio parahaemolyticus]MDG2889057.1 DEAD/DEAH box helicase family protein [Vibrio parahaemolyticus]